uniref:Microtubule-associated protein futsch n=1 Tax=Dendroctonus ponderosae TaxID=77166 RepID=A0AAR5PHH4_DENPD
MEAVNGGSLGEEKGGPPPPSPLTGCYLLVVIGEPHSGEHKDIILQKVAKGLLSWDVNECLVDLEKELAIIIEQGLEGEEARFGERLIQFASENLVTEILIHPAVSTLSQCVRNLLSSFTRHRHIIHAGYTFQANGSWALQDGTFSYSDFVEAFQEIEVQRVIHAYENGISIDLHCSVEGDWPRLPKEYFTKSCKVRVNPTDVLTTGSPSISRFIKYLDPFLVPTVLEDILESSDVVGNIRFSRPTLYVFPGGQGDAALFGINGFNMLLDGGYSRKACFWDFVRHLDRLDAVLMTRLNNSSVSGVSSVLERKKQGAVYPQIGHFFCNIQERKSLLSPDGDKDKDPLIVSLLDEGQNIIQDLRQLNLSPQVCYRDSDPIILYHKVGHGTLNMYVLSPDKNSREVREFLQKWNQSDSKLFAASKPGKDFNFPLQNLVSICALLIWQPANPNDTITRILYPGSTPQKKIFEGLERLKNMECMKHPICSVRSVIPAKKTKQEVLEKMAKTEKKTENKPLIEDSIKKEMNGDVIREKQVTKSDSLESDKEKRAKKIEDVRKSEKTDQREGLENGEKAKAKPRTVEPKPKPKEEPKKKAPVEKKGPPTPKKTIENKKNGEVKEKERKAPLKPSPQATPAKSTKDANNRKVIESKKALPKKEVTPKPAPAAESKPKPERKPISRRPKATKGPPSPIKKMTNGVQKPDSLSKRGKLDKEGTTDSSTVSTPSADQESILKKDISKLTPEELEQLKDKELEELKEEQDAIKEIEAVFRKGEAETDQTEPGVRKIKEISIDDHLDTEEYLIIEKEDIEHDSLDQEAKEDEMQKLVRDSEESEKQRKLSAEEELKTTDLPEEKPLKLSGTPDSKQQQITSPDDKAPSDDKKEPAEEEVKEIIESQRDEKVSANVESGATTTAPTLPEDERITLDEIKEDNGQPIEEKHIKEETKEKGLPVIQLPPKSQQGSPLKQPLASIQLDKQKHVRDIVKTPDEVADLPMHEEADYQEFNGDEKKTNEITPPKSKEDDVKPPTIQSGQEKKYVEEAPAPTNWKPTESVIENASVAKSDAVEKCDILEKAEVETKEKSDQDNNIVLPEERIKESMEDEWVVITKAEETVPEAKEQVLPKAEDIDRALADKVISDQIAQEVALGLKAAEEKDQDSETEVNGHEVRKEDEVEGIVESDKEDITALIEEADRKPIADSKSGKIPELPHALNDLASVQISIKQDLEKMSKVDEKLAELKSFSTEKDGVKVEKSTRSPEHAESVILTDSSPEDEGPDIFKDLTIDKAELGRKSPAEREEDVKKIVASVAEVLKSEAPLEEFQGKLPLVQELRETHITTQDSPILEVKIIKTDDIPPIPEEADDDLKFKSGAELSEDTSDKEDDAGVVHRMLVTASSEDGGEEIEICPAGTIIFSKSSESSGRSSPEGSQKTPSQKSSIVETLTDTASTAKHITDLETASKAKAAELEEESQAQEAATGAQEVAAKPVEATSAENVADAEQQGTREKRQTEESWATLEHTKDQFKSAGELEEKFIDSKVASSLESKVPVLEDTHKEPVSLPSKELSDFILDDKLAAPAAKEETERSSKLKEEVIDASKAPEKEQQIDKESTSIEQKEQLESKVDSKVPVPPVDIPQDSISLLPKDITDELQSSGAIKDLTELKSASKEAESTEAKLTETAAELKAALSPAQDERKESLSEGVKKEIAEFPQVLKDTTQEPSLEIKAESSPASKASSSSESEPLESQKGAVVLGKEADKLAEVKPLPEASLMGEKDKISKDASGEPEAAETTFEKIEHQMDQGLEYLEEKAVGFMAGITDTLKKFGDKSQATDDKFPTGSELLEATRELEEQLEDSLSSIGDRKLDGIIKSDTDPKDKGGLVDNTGKTWPCEDERNVPATELPKMPDHPISADLIKAEFIESAEDFTKKTEQSLETVLSDFKEEDKSILHDILQNETVKTGKDPEKPADLKGKDTGAKAQDEQVEHKEVEKSQAASPERRRSIIESAEEFVEKTEKTLESVFSAIEGGAKAGLQDILTDQKPKNEAAEEKPKAATDSKTTAEYIETNAIETKPQTPQVQDLKMNIIESVEEVVEKSTKTSGSVFSSMEEGGKTLLHDTLPEDPPKIEKYDSKTAVKEVGDLKKDILERTEDFIEKSSKSLESAFTAIEDQGKSLLHDILPGEKPKTGAFDSKSLTEHSESIPIEEKVQESANLKHEELIKDQTGLIEQKVGVIEPGKPQTEGDVEKTKTEVTTVGSKPLDKDTEEKVPDDLPEAPKDEGKPVERRGSIIESAEEFVQKSEKALESVMSAIGEGAKSLLHDSLVEEKSKADEVAAKVSSTDSKVQEKDSKDVVVGDKAEKDVEIGSKQEEVPKSEEHLSERKSSIIESAEEFMHKSEKALEAVFSAIGDGAKSLLKTDKVTDKPTSDPGSKLSDENSEERGDSKKSRTDEEPSKSPDVLHERRSSIVESAEEQVEKSEKATGSVLSAIGEGAKSMLHDILPEAKVKTETAAEKPKAEDHSLGSKSSGDDTEDSVISKKSQDGQESDSKDEELSKSPEVLHERKSSIAESVEEFVEKSEKAIESVFSTIGEGAKSLLNDVLPEAKVKTEKAAEKPKAEEHALDFKALDEDIKDSVISKKSQDEHKSNLKEEEISKSPEVLLERKSSIIESAEEFVEKSEKAMESVFSAIGEGAKSLLHDILPEPKAETEEAAEKPKAEAHPSDSKSSSEDTGDSTVSKKSQDEHKSGLKEEEISKSPEVVLERKSSIIESAEEFVEKSEKAMESVFSAIGEGAKSLLHDILPEPKAETEEAAEKPKAEAHPSDSKSSSEDTGDSTVSKKSQDEHKSDLKEEEISKTPEVLLERKSSIVESAEKCVEKSEKTLESVFTAIGEGAKSLLHDILPEAKAKTEEAAGKPKAEEHSPESTSLGDKTLEVQPADTKHEYHSEKSQTGLPQQRESILDAAEDFIEKSEKSLESVFSTIGGAAQSILPEEKNVAAHPETVCDKLQKTQEVPPADASAVEEASPVQGTPKEQKHLEHQIVPVKSAEKLDKPGLQEQELKASIEDKQKSTSENEVDAPKTLEDSASKLKSASKQEVEKPKAFSEDLKKIDGKQPESEGDREVKHVPESSEEVEHLAKEVEDGECLFGAKNKVEFKIEKDVAEKEKDLKTMEAVDSKRAKDLDEVAQDKPIDKDYKLEAKEETRLERAAQPKASKEDIVDDKNVHEKEKESEKSDDLSISTEKSALSVKPLDDLSKQAEVTLLYDSKLSEDFNVAKEVLEKEEKQLEEKADQLRKDYEGLSKLTKEISFEKCKAAEEYEVGEELLEKADRQLEDEAHTLRKSYEDLSKLVESAQFDKCKVSDEYKVAKEVLEREAKQIEEEADHLKKSYKDLSKLAQSTSFDKCKISDECKVAKEDVERDENQIEEEADHLRRSYEDLSKLAESTPFDKCKVADEYKVAEEVLEKEEEQVEEEADHLKKSYEGLSKLAESTSFDKCKVTDGYKVAKEILEKEEKQIEEEADHLKKSYGDLSKLAESTSFDKCKISEEFKEAKEEKQLEKEVDHLKKSYEDLSKLAESTVVDKCKVTDEYKVAKEILEKEEKQIENETDHLRMSYEDLAKLADSTPFDKCHTFDEYKVDKDVMEKEDRNLENTADALRKSYEDLSNLADPTQFEKCQISKPKVEKEQPLDKCKTSELKLEDSNKMEHFSASDKPVEEETELRQAGLPLESSKLISDISSLDRTQKIDEAKVETKSEAVLGKPPSSQAEKGEKESMEKSSVSQDSSALRVDQPEGKKLSISDVEISIKTDMDRREASQTFLDNERSIICDRTDAKVYIRPKESSAGQEGASTVADKTSPVMGAPSDKSSSDIESSGKTTPPTVPISPVAKELKSPSSKHEGGFSEQTETDEDDLSTKSQVAFSQSDLDELDMKLDPMSTSFYGALPHEDEEPLSGTYLYEITKAKFSTELPVAGKELQAGEMSLMTASCIGELPSGPDDDLKKDRVDSNGKPEETPAPSYLYEVTKARFDLQPKEMDLMTASFIGEELPGQASGPEPSDPMTTSVYFGETSEGAYDPIASWGKPLGLPSPAPPNNNEKGTPKREKKLPAHVTAKNKLNDDKKRPESPSKLKQKKANVVYVDLSYVPHHGNHYYSYVDFFKRIRARYYVFSGLEPSRQVYDALLEAKQTWEDKELDVTIIPTYDTDILGYWVAENEETLSKCKIDLAPSASRCTINLQDHETSCSAYRLEF